MASAQPNTRNTIADLTLISVNQSRIHTLLIKDSAGTITNDEKIELKAREKENADTYAKISADLDEAEKNSKLIEEFPNAIPDPRLGTNDESTSCKNYSKLPTWSGNPPEWVKCHYWVTKLFAAAEAAGLNEEAIKTLLIDKSNGPMYEMLTDERNAPITRIIRFIEIQFGQILDPREAEIAIHTMKPYEGESLQIFGQRIRAAIKPASRMKTIEKERKEYEETVGRAVLFKNAKSWLVTWAVNEEKREIINGGKPWNFQLLLTNMAGYAAANNVRRSRERKEFNEVVKRPNKFKDKQFDKDEYRVQKCKESDSESDSDNEDSLGNWYIHQANEKNDSSNSSSSSNSDSDESSSDQEEYERIERLVQEMNKFTKKYGKNKFRKQKFNKKDDKRSRKDKRKFDKSKIDSVNCIEMDRKHGTPMPLRVSWPSLPKDQLPKLAKVPKGVCFKCGLENPPHLANDPACPLFGEDFMDRACYACQRGLHTWQKCPLAKTSNHLHPADRKAKN